MNVYNTKTKYRFNLGIGRKELELPQISKSSRKKKQFIHNLSCDICEKKNTSSGPSSCHNLWDALKLLFLWNADITHNMGIN